ncbi:sigma-54 dependent transcriptional regulator [Paraglaciecola sp.]|uniref:sigma-54-dependent transcriptional regulator n=1 Tax=Paraglaciecola sp. TaxID=1920173 RepID=UPI0030F3DF43
MAQILVVDDNPDVLDALDLLLGLHHHQVITASNAKEALLAVAHRKIDIVLQDMNFSQDLTSGNEGKSLFYQLKQLHPTLPIVLLTAWTQLETAVELVKAGAADYLPKPWDDHKLLTLISQYGQAIETNKPATNKMIYSSPQMHSLMDKAHKVASSEVNVLITGANGCGKEVLADFIHQHSPRQQGPLIKVNIGALPPDLIEAELFGAEKGAFTGANSQRIGRFEAADKGTLFLDEIGNLSLAGQIKLLRVLQTGEFERLGSNTSLTSDARVVCATNANLPDLIKQGLFRQDLWFRLNVVELHLPQLNQRKADIVPLARHFIGKAYQLSPKSEQYLQQQAWPGNVRELQNACERAKVFAESDLLQVHDFSFDSGTEHPTEDDEKQRISHALVEHQWVIQQAANALGLSRQALYRRIEKYQLSSEKP